MSSTPSRRRPLDPAEISRTVVEVGRSTGLDVGAPELIKFTNNAVLRLPRAGLVLRIAGSAVTGRRARRVVRAAELLHRFGVPAVHLWAGAPQPLLVREHEVTVWVDVPEVRAPVAADLSGLLRRLHRAASAGDLPVWEPMAGIRRRLRTATGIPAPVLDFLARECDDVATGIDALADIEPLLEPGLMHGDAFLGNVIVGPAGPVLCDFDSTGFGPREWDLAPVAVGARRFEYGDLQAGFADAYGVDVTGWKGFEAMRRLRELQLVTSVLPVLAANPALRPQWQVRVESLRRRDENARWTPYAQLPAARLPDAQLSDAQRPVTQGSGAQGPAAGARG
jgi:aminoglycoside phosphotransferase (APT) family kinase protein